MNEVEKMYKNAGVEADYDYLTFFDDKVHKIGRTMHLCKEELKHWLENYQKDYVAIKVIRVDKVYPPFTAEKQLYILKIIVHSFTFNALDKPIWDKGWDIAIAKLVNIYWEVLTSAEQNEIKNILE